MARCRQPSPASSHTYSTRSITSATATLSLTAENHLLWRMSCGEQQRRCASWMDLGPAGEEGFAASPCTVSCLHKVGFNHILLRSAPAPASQKAVQTSSCRCRTTTTRCRQPFLENSCPCTTGSTTSATTTSSTTTVSS